MSVDMTDTVSDLTAARIAARRGELRLTKRDLAAKCLAAGHGNLTESVIGDLERGRPDATGQRRRRITVDELHALAQVLGCSPVQLLPGTPGKPKTAADIDQVVEWLQSMKPGLEHG